MFDEIEEDEREIRRLQRGELFRRPKPKLPEQQGDVMERREFDRLLDQIVYGTDTQTRIDAKAQAIREHAALVEQRVVLMEALRRLSRTGRGALALDEYRDWVKEVADNALAIVEQGEGREERE